MDTGTFLWALAAAITGGAHVFSQKIVAHENRSAAFNGMMNYAIPGIFGVILLLWSGTFPERYLLIGLFGFLAGSIHAVGNYLRIESLRQIDSVLYFPVSKVLGPILVVLIGVFFFEDSISFGQYIGIALSLCVPLLLISSVEHARQRDLPKGMLLLVASTTLTSLTVLFDKLGLGYADSLFLMLIASQFAAAFSSLALFHQSSATVASLDRRDVWLGLVSGLIGTLAVVTLFVALQRGLVSLVYVIHAHYILIPIILSIWWYKEHINVRKFAAIVVSSLAIIMLYDL